MPTGIEWTDETWNPVTGCTKVSPGCDHCYAETITNRFKRHPFEQVILHPDRLEQPSQWARPRRIFVCSMGDLFHTDVPWEFIYRVFVKMMANRQHTFQVLTKRPGRMSYFANHLWPCPWPENVWAGTSVESQKYAPRLDVLARVPAKVRFVSYEPALAPVNLKPWLGVFDPDDEFRHEIFEETHLGAHDEDDEYCPESTMYPPRGKVIDWVIAGGESGPSARPAHPDWFRQVRDDCQEAGVPYFFKQWGQYRPLQNEVAGHLDRCLYVSREGETVGAGYRAPPFPRFEGYAIVDRVGKKAAGALLDGREWHEFPATGAQE